MHGRLPSGLSGEIYGPSSPEFLEFSEQFKFDWGLTSDISDSELHEQFLQSAAQALRPQDKVRWPRTFLDFLCLVLDRLVALK